MKNWNWTERRVTFSGKRGSLQLVVRLVTPDEVDKVMALQRRVHENMPDPSQLAETGRDEIAESTRLDVCLGVFDGDRLAAFALMVANRESPSRNTGQKNGFIPRECVSFDTAFVDPDYRGLGMQRYLLQARDEIAVQLGAKYALVTVDPKNEFSLRNILSQGFEIIARKQLYGGLDRYVLKKDLQK